MQTRRGNQLVRALRGVLRVNSFNWGKTKKEGKGKEGEGKTGDFTAPSAIRDLRA